VKKKKIHKSDRISVGYFRKEPMERAKESGGLEREGDREECF